MARDHGIQLFAACTAMVELQSMRLMSTWTPACPHLMSLLRPGPTLQEDMTHRLRSESTLALVRFGLVDSVKVRSQADLACTYLCDDRANRSVRAIMYGQ
jgi:hypothetical protein